MTNHLSEHRSLQTYISLLCSGMIDFAILLPLPGHGLSPAYIPTPLLMGGKLDLGTSSPLCLIYWNGEKLLCLGEGGRESSG